MLRIGVLLDSRTQEGWVRDALLRVRELPSVDIHCAVIGSGRRRRASLPRRLLDRLDHRLRSRDEPWFRHCDPVAALGLPVAEVRTDSAAGHWRFDAAACDRLREACVDVWLCAGKRRPAFAATDIARLGAWGLELGRGRPAADFLAGAAEVAAGSAVTAVAVVDYAGDPAGRALTRSFGATVTNSLRLNRLHALHKGCCLWRRLLMRAADPLPRVPALPADYPPDPPAGPGAGRLAAALALRMAKNQLRKRLWRAQWQIAWQFADEDAWPPERASLCSLVPPADRFWADPFAVREGGRHFIFFEELLYASGRGRIMAVEVREGRGAGEPFVVLERPYHLSYPFLFRWQDRWWMVPETAENGTVELYRCERFPDRWALECLLLDGVTAYDATLWQGDDAWWMFVGIAPPGATDGDELHLYRSESPTGPWLPHRANPVVSDARSGRPAGPLFRDGGRLYRPSQDCSVAYGHAVRVNRIERLDADGYREVCETSVTPAFRAGAHCLHTIGSSGRLRVLDYQLWRPRFGGM